MSVWGNMNAHCDQQVSEHSDSADADPCGPEHENHQVTNENNRK